MASSPKFEVSEEGSAVELMLLKQWGTGGANQSSPKEPGTCVIRQTGVVYKSSVLCDVNHSGYRGETSTGVHHAKLLPRSSSSCLSHAVRSFITT